MPEKGKATKGEPQPRKAPKGNIWLLLGAPMLSLANSLYVQKHGGEISDVFIWVIYAIAALLLAIGVLRTERFAKARGGIGAYLIKRPLVSVVVCVLVLTAFGVAFAPVVISPWHRNKKPIEMPVQAVSPFSPLSDAQVKDLSQRHGTLFLNFHAEAGPNGVGMMDNLPCDQTFANTITTGGKAGIILDPVGLCLDGVNTAIEQKMGRHISESDHKKLVSYLSQNKGRIRIASEKNSQESNSFASDWYQVFKDSGWQMADKGVVDGIRGGGGSPFASGVYAELPGTGTCIPPDDKTLNGKAMYAIFARTGRIGVSCSKNSGDDLITVLFSPATYAATGKP